MLSETKVDEGFIAEMAKFRELPAGVSLLEACSRSVVLFAEKMLGMRLYAWQVDFLTRIQRRMEEKSTSSKEFIALTSRQIGKSTAVAIFSLWVCVFNKYPSGNRNATIIGIISASDKQSIKLLHDVDLYIRTGDSFMQETYLDASGESLFGKKFFSKLLDEKEANNTTTITFKAYNKDKHGLFLLKDSLVGSVIKSFPPTNGVLGETFTIVGVDEAGLTEKITDQFFYETVYPTGNKANAIRLYTSTPWVPSGFFYRLADPNDDYSEHPAERLMFTIDAIRIEDPEYYETVMKTVNQMNLDGKVDEVQRAYYCRFVKGESSYFNPDNIKGLFQEYSAVESYGGECDMGIDFGGQTISRTVVTITAMTDKGIQRLYHRIYPVAQDLSLIDDVTELLKRFNVQRIIPDDCPAGWHVIEKMRALGWNIEPMNFKADKVKKYGAFRAALNRGELLSYKDDELKTEMLALEFSQGKMTTQIVHAPGYTDDLIDSFVMSCYFFIEEEDGFKYYDVDDYANDD
jgi:hypothetical protein